MTRDEVLAPLEKVYPETEEAIELSSMLIFDKLGWDLIQAENEMDVDPALLGCDHQGDVVLKRQLYPSFLKLNPDLPQEALNQAADALSRDRSMMDITQANKDVTSLLKNGIKVSYRDKDGKQVYEKVKIIDWNAPEKIISYLFPCCW